MSKKDFKTNIGGQALIEGIMMRGPQKTSIAVRKSDGEIVIKTTQNAPATKGFFAKLPIIRGIVAFFTSMVVGTKALMYSAEFFDIEEEEQTKPSKLDEFFEKMFANKDVLIYISVILGILFSVGLFILLPTLIVSTLKLVTKSQAILTICEGITRITIFVTYLFFVSKLKDVKRVFMYHGAEHKTIACYESGEELSIENVRKYSRLHPRCGTSFLIEVMIISIIVFSFVSWDSIAMRIVIKLSMLPFVAGLSYEFIKFAGRHCDNPIINILNQPGLWLQNITTSEPDDDQIQVAITAMKEVIPTTEGEDKW